MFWINLKGIWNNLPLTLSDTDKPDGVSLTRIIISVLILFIIVIESYVAYFQPQYLDKVGPYMSEATKAVLLLIAANVAKKAIVTVGDIFKKE
jgi:hypothetical protein